MRNQLPSRFASMIVERPEIMSRYNSEASAKYDDLAQTLKIMEATKAVVLDAAEIEKSFGKCWKTSISQNLKKRGIKKPRVGMKNGSVYIWETKL